MDEENIRVHPTRIEPAAAEKLPPIDNSDAWYCEIGGPADVVGIYLHNRAKQVILEHAYETPQHEVGGALVGGVYTDRGAGDRCYIEVTDAVWGDFTQGSSARLTFTPDTWSQIVSEVEAQFEGKRIVGWYHTHPGHGVFLSEPDRFIQNNFFGHGNQLALVVDHLRGCAAFFTGSERGEGGIRKSLEFTWDDGLYQIRRRQPALGARGSRAEMESPQSVAGEGRVSSSLAGGADVEPWFKREVRVRRLARLLRPWRWRKKPQPLVPSEHGPAMIRVEAADAYSPRVERLLKAQERARHQTVGPGLLDNLGCIVSVVVIALLFVLPVLSLVRPELLKQAGHHLPQISVGVSPVEAITLGVFALVALVAASLLSVLWHEIRSSRSRR